MSKIVSIKVDQNTKVQVITSSNEWFPVKIQNLVDMNWLYTGKTQIHLHIAIIEEPSMVLVLKSDSHSENVTVGLLCNPWPIQLYQNCFNRNTSFQELFFATPYIYISQLLQLDCPSVRYWDYIIPFAVEDNFKSETSFEMLLDFFVKS